MTDRAGGAGLVRNMGCLVIIHRFDMSGKPLEVWGFIPIIIHSHAGVMNYVFYPQNTSLSLYKMQMTRFIYKYQISLPFLEKEFVNSLSVLT